MKIYYLEGSVDTPFSVTASDLADRLRADLAAQGITGPFIAPPVISHGIDACEFFGPIRVVRQWRCDARLVTKGHLEIMASVFVETDA